MINIDALKSQGCQLYWPGTVGVANAPKAITANGDVKQILPFPGAGIGVFDGTGDYVSAAYSTDLEPAGGDFTYECWFNIPNVSGQKTIFAFNTDYHLGIFINGSHINYFMSSTGSSWNLICGDDGPLNGAGSNTVTANEWHHLAFVRSGNNWYGFYDGKLDLSVTVSGTIVSRSETLNIGRWGNNGYWMNGCISEFAFSKGICRYSAPFVPVKAQVENDSYTKLLLHFLNPLTDSSNNNLKINPSGSFTLSNTYPSPITTNSTVTVFGGASYLSTPVNTDDILGISGDNWTFETYILFTSSIIDNNILFMGNESNDSDRFDFMQYYGPTFSLGAGYGYSITDSTSGTIRWQAIATPQLNTWYHIALVKTGLNVELYINGQIQTKTTGATLSANIPARVTYPLIIGKYRQSYYHFQGMLSECRFSNVSRYAESFTPSTTRYVADANTKLLMHLDRIPGVIDDYSPTPKQITAYGNATQLCSPCGSGIAAFDGVGDYLLVAQPNTTTFVLGGNDFCIEGWCYFKAVNAPIIANRANGSTRGWVLHYSSTGKITLAAYVGGWVEPFIDSTGITVSLNTWYHIALTRTGSSWKLFVNGNLANSVTNSGGLDAYWTNENSQPISIGTAAYNIEGYANANFSDLALSIGSGRYTSNFTPPTQPFKPDPYTKLLLHMDGVGNAFYDSSDPLGDNGFPILPDGVTIAPNGTFTSVKGKDGRSYWKFDGSTNYITISDHDAWSMFLNNFTICGWVKFDSIAGNRIIAGQYVDTNSRWLLQWATGNFIQLYGVLSSAATFDYTAAFTPVAGTWYHITVQRSGSSCLIYVNALPQTVTITTAFTTVATNIASTLIIGKINTAYQNGVTKDLMIFKGKALSQDQIAALMTETYIF